MTATTPDTASKSIPKFKRRFLVRFVTVLIGGMLLDGYVLGIIGTVISRISTELSFTPLWEGLIVASTLFGMFIGSPIGGWLSDKFGRKPLFVIDISLFVIASGLQFFIDSPMELFLVRLLMGVAIGMEYSVGWPLMAEFAPTRMRGRLMGLSLVAFYAGFMAAFVVGYLLTTMTDLGWREILGSSTILAVALLIGRIGMPESARWLWQKGRREEAKRVVDTYMEESDVLDDTEAESPPSNGSVSMLFSKRYWRATLFTSMFWFCAVTPYFAIATFAEKVLAGYGLSGGLAGGVGLSALALAGVIVAVMLIDKVGRRFLTVPPQWICAVLLVAIGIWAGAPPMIILAIFLVFSFFNAMYNTLTGVYPGEVFPTEIRGIGTGFATAVSRIGAGIGTFLFPWAMVTFGQSATMLGAAALVVAGAALSQWLAPETRGKTLAECCAGHEASPAVEPEPKPAT